MIVENGVYEEEDILELLSSGLLPQRPEDSIPQTDAGEVIWDVLCKCWSSDPAYRPSAADVSQIMHSVHQTSDGVILEPPSPVVGEDTSVQDLASDSEGRIG
ncbi:unnamed protein product [Rhizoctonia solani]|uniref:Serine-threonine/tyrosine-protein kinase catalytic domain-containing protein n=1 Tax=Rhizoctonia solani TaxID=456999 RepID=A0A8H3D688_9AGAM|nr:unnamed protein product [Rhizoctonia solani]CAE6512048.1 unnamed protein product [Rhizoctonia solani]